MNAPHPLTNHRNLTALFSTRAPAALKKEMQAAAKHRGLPFSVALREAAAEWTQRNKKASK